MVAFPRLSTSGIARLRLMRHSSPWCFRASLKTDAERGNKTSGSERPLSHGHHDRDRQRLAPLEASGALATSPRVARTWWRGGLGARQPHGGLVRRNDCPLGLGFATRSGRCKLPSAPRLATAVLRSKLASRIDGKERARDRTNAPWSRVLARGEARRRTRGRRGTDGARARSGQGHRRRTRPP